MTGSSSRGLPGWRSLDELVDYFDTHDMGELLDQMPRVNFTVDVRRKRHLVAIDNDILVHIEDIAKRESLSFEELINTWLREKVRETRS